MNKDRALLIVDTCLSLILGLGGLVIYGITPALLPFSVMLLMGSLIVPACHLADYITCKHSSRKE